MNDCEIIDFVIGFEKASLNAKIESDMIRNGGVTIPFLSEEFSIIIMNVYTAILFNKVCVQLFPYRHGTFAFDNSFLLGVFDSILN